jgi:hypothetical protein
MHGDYGFYQYRLGVGAGAFATFSISPRFALQPELLFVMKGAASPTIELTSGSGQTIGTAEVTHEVDYLEFPLLVRFRIPASGPVSPIFVCGPAMAFKLSEQTRLDASPVVQIMAYDSFRDADLGLAIGAGVEIGRGPDRAVLEARYTVALINAREDSYRTTRNGAFLIMAGYAMHR